MSSHALFDAKNHLTRLVYEAEQGQVIQITRHGKPAAVLLGMDRFQELEKGNQGFSTRLTRFLHEWPPSSDTYDPFVDVRVPEAARDANL